MQISVRCQVVIQFTQQHVACIYDILTCCLHIRDYLPGRGHPLNCFPVSSETIQMSFLILGKHCTCFFQNTAKSDIKKDNRKYLMFKSKNYVKLTSWARPMLLFPTISRKEAEPKKSLPRLRYPDSHHSVSLLIYCQWKK